MDVLDMALFLEGDGFEGSHGGGVLKAGGVLLEEALAFVFALQGVFKNFTDVHFKYPSIRWAGVKPAPTGH